MEDLALFRYDVFIIPAMHQQEWWTIWCDMRDRVGFMDLARYLANGSAEKFGLEGIRCVMVNCPRTIIHTIEIRRTIPGTHGLHPA